MDVGLVVRRGACPILREAKIPAGRINSIADIVERSCNSAHATCWSRSVMPAWSDPS